MEKIFIYARMFDILCEVEIKMKQIIRISKYPPTKSFKIQLNRIKRAIRKWFDCIQLLKEHQHLQRQVRTPFPSGGIVVGPANVSTHPEKVMPLDKLKDILK